MKTFFWPVLTILLAVEMAAAQPNPAAGTTSIANGIGTVTLQTYPSGAPASGFGGIPMRLIVDARPPLVKATFLGVSIHQTDETLQSQLKLPEGMGLVVMAVRANGPAAAAGLEEHDVIYKVDDQYAINESQFEVVVRSHKAGDRVELTVYRQGAPLKITATLGQEDEPKLSWMLEKIQEPPHEGVLEVPSGVNFLNGPGTPPPPPPPPAR